MLSRLMTRKEQFLLLFFAFSICVGAAVVFWRSGSAPAGEPAIEKPAPALQKEASPPVPTPPPAPVVVSPKAAPPVATPPVPEAAAQHAGEAGPDDAKVTLAVGIAGAVQKAGIYRLPEKSRVGDLIETAGGTNADADVSDLNLAAPLLDGTTLTVPTLPMTVNENGKLMGHGGQSAANLNPPEYTISGWRHVQASGPVQRESRETTTGPAAEVKKTESAPGLIDLNSASAQTLETLPGIGPQLAQQIVQYRQQTPFQTVDDLQNVQGIGPKRLETVRSLVSVGGGR